MSENLEILRKRIESLSDDELIAVVTVDRVHYRDEAIAFAEAELEHRGLRIMPEEVEPSDEPPISFWDEMGYGQKASSDAETEADSEPEEDGEDSEADAEPDETQVDSEVLTRVGFKVFRGHLITWDGLFSQAAEFASEIGPEHVISISHTADNSEGVVTVWYRF